jgi:phage/plasmid-associated DNA primase
LAAENDALRRRAVLCRHTRKIDRKAEGARLERLQSDPRAKEAILAWLVEGAMRLIANGGEVNRTDDSLKHLEAWLNSGDRLGQFLREATVRVWPGDAAFGDPDTNITREQMWGLYVEWCEDQHIPEGRRIQSKNALVQRIDQRSEYGSSDSQRNRAGQRGWRNWQRNPGFDPNF